MLSHFLSHDNLGCVALSIANIKLIDRAAEIAGVEIEYIMLVTNNINQVKLDITKNKYSYVVFPRSKQVLKHPLQFLKGSFLKNCDIVINIAGGDGFTDIYGFARLLSESYMTVLCGLKRKRIIFAPQTIGPFNKWKSKLIAKYVLKKCYYVFARDGISYKTCENLNVKKKTTEVIDVAFALPYKKENFSSSSLKVGLNISGLLYNGGYNRNNYFNLSIDYKKLMESLISKLTELNYEVHLISHVTSSTNIIEDDYQACSLLNKDYPNTILAPKFISPIEVKSYIAGMDVFIGARMHSTIAAISSGVPVIPIAYSRKFNGLYNTLDYPYYVDAKNIESEKVALDKIISFINEKNNLLDSVVKSKIFYEEKLEKYVNVISKILSDISL